MESFAMLVKEREKSRRAGTLEYSSESVLAWWTVAGMPRSESCR